MKQTVWVFLLSFLLCGHVSGQEGSPPFTKADFVRVLPPSSRTLIGSLSKSVDAKILASHIQENVPVAYGFSSGISKEKGSFKLGMLMADLETTIRAGGREMVSKAVHALTDGLTKLQAPIPLITATINLGAAVTSRIEIESMDKTTLPVLRPFMEDFLSKEGHLLFYRFGEWAQATRLAALSGEKGKVEAAVQFLRGANLAAYFLEELKAKKLPMGVMDSLKSIAEIEKKSLIGEEEVRRTLKAVTTIIEIMG